MMLDLNQDIKMAESYTADFETTTDRNDLRIWAWGICNINNFDDFQYDNNMESFIKWLENHSGCNIYFHNLRFDGEFIISWLLKNGFKYNDDLVSKTFNCIIAGTGQFYKMDICFYKKGKYRKMVHIYDSLKKLPFPVKKIALAFELPILKGEIDYKATREVGHKLTEEELAYLRNDVEIMARALHIQINEGLTHMTIGSDALNSFKKIIGNKLFNTYFPKLDIEVDRDIRRAYRGGYTYTNKIFQAKDVGEGLVYDVNSMYPSVMYDENLPYGVPIFFDGEYIPDDEYPLYIQKIKADLVIKNDHIPTIQCKGNMYFNSTEYIESTNGILTMYVTNVDLEIIFEQYDVLDIEYINGYKFKCTKGLFCAYIDTYMEMKKNNTGAKRQLAKLMLNNLYGKFASNPKTQCKIPYLNEENEVEYKTITAEDKEPVYTPVGVFVTSYARARIQRTAQSVYHRFCYCDTDSIHIINKDIPNIDIDDKELGKWALEGEFVRARFLRAKTYIEEYPDGTINVKCAGLPDNLKELCNFDNFKVGLTLHGKLLPKRYEGGVVLEETDFTIK
jgi:hypothetical protein